MRPTIFVYGYVIVGNAMSHDLALHKIVEAKGTPLEHSLFLTEQAARDAWHDYMAVVKLIGRFVRSNEVSDDGPTKTLHNAGSKDRDSIL